MYSNQRSAPSIPAYKYETIINRNFKKVNKGFGSSNSRFYGDRVREGPGPGSYHQHRASASGGSLGIPGSASPKRLSRSFSERSISFPKSKRFRKHLKEKLINIGPATYDKPPTKLQTV